RDFHVTGVQTCALPILRKVTQAGLKYVAVIVSQKEMSIFVVIIHFNVKFLYLSTFFNLEVFLFRVLLRNNRCEFKPAKLQIGLQIEERRVGKEWRSRRS